MAANLQCARCHVSVSTGFIDLLNHIAHAKAIDRIQSGYLRQYVAGLVRAGATNPPPPPNLEDRRYWTEAVLSDQASLFNQMVGMTVALQLSHQYLAHVAKHATQCPHGACVPINNFLDPNEWDASVCLRHRQLPRLRAGHRRRQSPV